MCNLYSVIETLCEHKNVSINRMCKESGVPQGTIGDLKSGRTKWLSATNLTKLSAYFGVTVDEITNGTLQGNLDHELRGYRMGREAEKETATLSSDGQVPIEFVTTYSRLSESAKAELTRYAQYLLTQQGEQ